MDSSTKTEIFIQNGKENYQADGPFEIIEWLNDNAYKVYGISATFNVANLSPCLDDDYLKELRANSSSQGENDGGPPLLVSYGLSKS